jgi:hypothetical protein
MKKQIGFQLTWAAAMLFTLGSTIASAAMEAEDYLLLARDLRSQLLKAAWRTSYASGDFNGDRFPDLAIGVPWGMASNVRAAGLVLVLYGTAEGLPAMSAAVTYSHGRLNGMPGSAQAGALVGYSLAVGDFDNNGIDDLAVGAPGWDVTSAVDAGAVFVGLGRAGQAPSGALNFAAFSAAFTQSGTGRNNLRGESQEGDLLGFSLAAGKFNSGNYWDLAIGVPGEDVLFRGSQQVDAGAVVVAYGNNGGPDGTTSTQMYTQEPNNGDYSLPGSPEAGDVLGFSLAAGNFNGDTFDDLAIGAPGEDVYETVRAGAVHVLEGAMNGLRPGGYTEAFHQSHDNPQYRLPGRKQTNAYFGFSLAAGDFNGDSRDDLAIGIPGYDVTSFGRTRTYSGAFVVAQGGGAGNRLEGEWYTDPFSETSVGNLDLPGEALEKRMLAMSLASADFNDDGYDDLAIGVPGAERSRGIVYVKQGSVNGVASPPATTRQFGQSQPGDQDDIANAVSEDGDLFGLDLGTGRFNSDRLPDLAISTPWEEVSNPLADFLPAANGRMVVDGFTNIVYGSLQQVVTAIGDRYLWSSRHPTAGVWTRGAMVDGLIADGITAAIGIARRSLGLGIEIPIHRVEPDSIRLIYDPSIESESIRVGVSLNVADLDVIVTFRFGDEAGPNGEDILRVRSRTHLLGQEILDEVRDVAMVPLFDIFQITILPDHGVEVLVR